MGNRANVYFAAKGERPTAGVYLHWNGGPESVYRFVDEVRRRMGDRGHDIDYMPARFAQVVGDFMDQDAHGGTSLGLVCPPEAFDAEHLAKVYTDNGDNGFYVFYEDHVDRFVTNYDDDTYQLVQWTPEQVAAELEEANKSDYATALPEFFAELDEKLYGKK